jgi:UDP-N-acetylmuramate--alanine ligase
MQILGLKKIKKIYMIGIGGVSMSSLAKYFSLHGCSVSGSDMQKGDQTDALVFYGVRYTLA